ncbi:MAG: histidinol-phosphate transaminase [Propionibacteriaceae bacterium]|jgi:histidinol-phosphate aminotransferase|nr:histidinol-phosphate transaminase [Propionibacteriaceae bacterium]
MLPPEITLAGLPLRPGLAGQRPYGAPQFDVPVRLNVNENPYPPSAAIAQEMAEAVKRAAASVNRYPDREAVGLRSKLARYLGHGLLFDQVWAANGSNEVMVQILQAFGGPGRRLLTFTPTYSMYPEYARDTYTELVSVPRRADYSLDLPAAWEALELFQPSVVIIANPNNPTGSSAPLPVIERLVKAAPGIVVVDEAYQEFSRQSADTALKLLPKYGNLIVARTMSKAFAFAGGRVGYAAANQAIVEALRIVRLPYHLSAVTQAVAGVALDHAAEMLAQVDRLRQTRDETIARLRDLGCHVIDSDANFCLFGRFPDRHGVWQILLEQGVLVREVGPDGYLRVSTGSEQEMERFLWVLGRILGRDPAQAGRPDRSEGNR